MKTKLTFSLAEFAVAEGERSLTGLLIPFNEVSGLTADPVTGETAQFMFADASTVMLPDDPSDVILNYGHDKQSLYMQVGAATALAASAQGVEAKFAIAETPEGDRVLALAKGKVLKAFSAEVEGDFEAGKDGVQNAKAAILTGAAVIRNPAFAGAKITNVAASAAAEGGNIMTCTKCGAIHANGVTTCDPAVLAAFTAKEAAFTKAEGVALMAKVEEQAAKIAEFEKIKLPVGPGHAQLIVKEEPIYRFAGSTPAPSGFDFAADLLAAGKDGDGAALDRLRKFTAARIVEFADQPTTTADVAAINPSQYRPDLFLGQAPTPPSPLYDCFVKGTLDSVTPFFWSKLDRTNTDVGVADHVEDVNPESRDLVTAAGATVTPTPMSGRVHITREVADQGGNPVVSGLILSEFDRSFAIAKETKTAALITAAMASITALATITTGTTGLATSAAVEAGLVDLQFLATGDGFRFTRAFGHVDLYKALAGATLTTTGEKVYPIIAPSNRDGSMADKFAHMNVAGYEMYPAASLGVTGGTKNSLVSDPNAVHVWASGLQRLDKLAETVAGWDMAVFAYFAGVVYDLTGLRKITYTP
jgi:hypothetical protein